MATLMDLAVSLTAKTGKFSAGFKKADKTVGGFASKLKTVGGAIAKFAAPLAGIASVAGISMFVKKSMESIDVIAKLSDEVGIATERLVGFHHAAALSGTSGATLNKGLQRLVRTLGEASKGYGEGKKGLDLLGLDAQKLINKSPADALVDIAEKIRGLENSSQRAAAAYGLFGRQGQDLMNFLLMGADGLREAQREAERLGLTFSRIDAAKVEAANDAIQRMKSAFTGVFQSVVIDIADDIESIATKITDVIAESGGLRQIFIDAFKDASVYVRELVSFLEKLVRKMEQMQRVGQLIAMSMRVTSLIFNPLQAISGKDVPSPEGLGDLGRASPMAAMNTSEVQDTTIVEKLDQLIKIAKQQKIAVVG